MLTIFGVDIIEEVVNTECIKKKNTFFNDHLRLNIMNKI